MATIENQNSADEVGKGTTLFVSGASSENDAILAVENYLREHRSEELTVTVSGKKGDEGYEIRLD